MSTRVIEDPGALGAVGGVGGQGVIEERHGFPGALGAVGGVGGHVGAPHVSR